MHRPDNEKPLAALIHDLKTRVDLEGSLGESPASLLAYMEELERRISRLEDKERRKGDG